MQAITLAFTCQTVARLQPLGLLDIHRYHYVLICLHLMIMMCNMRMRTYIHAQYIASGSADPRIGPITRMQCADMPIQHGGLGVVLDAAPFA